MHVATMDTTSLMSTMVNNLQQWLYYCNNGCFVPLLLLSTTVVPKISHFDAYFSPLLIIVAKFFVEFLQQ
jgi:hypothetical protein